MSDKNILVTFEKDKYKNVIQIPWDEYKYLLERNSILKALEQAGVDNWDGYSYAQELM